MTYKLAMLPLPRSGVTTIIVAAWMALGGGGCAGAPDEALTARLNEASSKIVECQKETAAAKNEVTALKRQLAEAMANPSKVVLTDPDIIELVAKVKAAKAAAAPADAEGGDEVKLGKGDLNPRDASRIVLQGAGAMQACYERALKKNASLQYQAGVGLTLGITVRPTGNVSAVDVAPSVDSGMTQCIKAAALHWKFPKFAGAAVTIEQRVSLTPKT